MTKKTLIFLFLALLVLGTAAILLLNRQQGGLVTPPTATSTPPQEEPLVPVTETGEQMTAFLTGYTYYDNTPPGSATIAFAQSYGYPTVHQLAGGTGTYADPITIAVGHVIEEGISTPDFAPGTIFYIPNVRRYFIVEDLCGDGPTPQLGPCHVLTGDSGAQGATVWLDMWIGGGPRDTQEEVDACMYALTGTYQVIKDPLSTYVVEPRPLFSENGCTRMFGNKAILQI